MSAGPEDDQLVGIVDVRALVVIGALQLRQVDQQFFGRGLARQRRNLLVLQSLSFSSP